jgi:hypothetical protein
MATKDFYTKDFYTIRKTFSKDDITLTAMITFTLVASMMFSGLVTLIFTHSPMTAMGLFWMFISITAITASATIVWAREMLVSLWILLPPHIKARLLKRFYKIRGVVVERTDDGLRYVREMCKMSGGGDPMKYSKWIGRIECRDLPGIKWCREVDYEYRQMSSVSNDEGRNVLRAIDVGPFKSFEDCENYLAVKYTEFEAAASSSLNEYVAATAGEKGSGRDRLDGRQMVVFNPRRPVGGDTER